MPQANAGAGLGRMALQNGGEGNRCTPCYRIAIAIQGRRRDRRDDTKPFSAIEIRDLRLV